HQAGLGWMTTDHNLPGYRGALNNTSVTIAEVLKNSGYATYLTGKWHVASNPDRVPSNHNWPLQRGFEKFYGILMGAANYFDPGSLCRGNTFISPFTDPMYRPEQYYFTDAISDNSVQFIREHDKE